MCRSRLLDSCHDKIASSRSVQLIWQAFHQNQVWWQSSIYQATANMFSRISQRSDVVRYLSDYLALMKAVGKSSYVSWRMATGISSLPTTAMNTSWTRVSNVLGTRCWSDYSRSRLYRYSLGLIEVQNVICWWRRETYNTNCKGPELTSHDSWMILVMMKVAAMRL
jgi:hypothetical protein